MVKVNDNIVYILKHERLNNITRKEYHALQKEYATKIIEYELQRRYIDIKDCIINKNRYGKPYFENYQDIKYNVSHCNGMVAVAFSKDEIGIDIEDIKIYRTNIISKLCTNEEVDYIKNGDYSNKRFFKIWTLKEAYMKAIGMGFAYSPKDVTFVIDEKEMLDDKKNDDSFNDNNITIKRKKIDNVKVHQKELKGGYILSLCSLSANNCNTSLVYIDESSLRK